MTLFGKLRVWDTEQNNGVLIYLLLADHAIEVVADRGLARAVAPREWEHLVAGMRELLRSGRHEEALGQAIGQVSALLERHFPKDGAAGSPGLGNELPDAPATGPEYS